MLKTKGLLETWSPIDVCLRVNEVFIFLRVKSVTPAEILRWLKVHGARIISRNGSVCSANNRIRKDRHYMLNNKTRNLGISLGSGHSIFEDQVGDRKVSAHRVPKNLRRFQSS